MIAACFASTRGRCRPRGFLARVARNAGFRSEDGELVMIAGFAQRGPKGA